MELLEVPLADIGRMENTRAKIGDLGTLMDSIKDQGLLSPVIIAENFDKNIKKKYILVAGNRRYEAFFKLGKKIIPCFLKEIKNIKELMLTNLQENIQRNSTTPWEEGRFISDLIDKYDMSEKEIVSRLSVNKNYVKIALRAYRVIPINHRDDVVYSSKGRVTPGKISMEVAGAIHSMADAFNLGRADMDKIYSMVKKNDLKMPNLKSVMTAMSGGVPLEKAFNIPDNLIHVRTNIALSKKEADELKKKYNLNLGEIFKKIIYGEIIYPIADPLLPYKEKKNTILRKKPQGK